MTGARRPDDELSVFSGNAFVISDAAGDIHPGVGAPRGFFWEDTRFVSRFLLRVDEQPCQVLSNAHVDPFAAQMFLVPGDPIEAVTPGYAVPADDVVPALSIMRRRLISGEWLEELEFHNHRAEPLAVTVRVEVDTDFADLPEVRHGAVKARSIERECRKDALVLRYARGAFLRETTVFCVDGGSVHEGGITFEMVLEAHGHQRRRVRIAPHAEQPGRRQLPPRARGFEETRSEVHRDLDRWLNDAPVLFSDWSDLRELYRRTLIDYAALRFTPEGGGGASVPVAGMPWQMALRGSDSLISGYQALPFYPEMAATTLRLLATHQGVEDDRTRGGRPGEILQELRSGESSLSGDKPFWPYYGSARSTPLWLILLGEYVSWTGDTALAQALEPNARAALAWIDDWGDRDGDGYVESAGRGLDGPVAWCDVQGLVYDAKLRTARLAAAVWNDAPFAAQLRKDAEALRSRFERDFWLSERGVYAVALDADKAPVDRLTSRLGQLLWSGIAAPQHADQLMRRLFGDELFSGWGMRSVARTEAAFHPLALGRGAVCAGDNALIAQGLAAYGNGEEATRLAVGLVRAATHFGHRLPQAFAGYARGSTQFPVPCPGSASPHALASGAPFLFLRTLLGMEPADGGLRTRPHVPESVKWLTLEGVHGPAGRASVQVGTRPGRDSARVPRPAVRPVR